MFSQVYSLYSNKLYMYFCYIITSYLNVHSMSYFSTDSAVLHHRVSTVAYSFFFKFESGEDKVSYNPFTAT